MGLYLVEASTVPQSPLKPDDIDNHLSLVEWAADAISAGVGFVARQSHVIQAASQVSRLAIEVDGEPILLEALQQNLTAIWCAHLQQSAIPLPNPMLTLSPLSEDDVPLCTGHGMELQVYAWTSPALDALACASAFEVLAENALAAHAGGYCCTRLLAGAYSSELEMRLIAQTDEHADPIACCQAVRNAVHAGLHPQDAQCQVDVFFRLL
ncbi:MAG TPA: hypothetical protein VKX46_16765 [Ktedonobacteraceae bacterium]|nr:hypothetical protein [Ktedonobacteraceae bacterium]